MRLLLADPPLSSAAALGSRLGDAHLAALYAVPAGEGRWLRANFATSVDGAATGGDGRSGSVNTPADGVVFDLVRALSDVVVVGAGTARGEGYGPLSVSERWGPLRQSEGRAMDLPVVVVSTSLRLPARLTAAATERPGSVLLATHEGSPGLAAAREEYGGAQVLVCGRSGVDPAELLDQLAERGWTRVLTEGGPQLFGSFLEAGVVDELCLSLTPRILAGAGPRLTAAASRDDAFVPHSLVEQDGTLMGRWLRA